MKFQVVICITLSLLGTALSGPMEIDYNGMIQQDAESEGYDGMIQQDIEAEEYFDGMIQQDSEAEDFDGMIPQDIEAEDFDGMIEQDMTDEDEAQEQGWQDYLKRLQELKAKKLLELKKHILRLSSRPLYRYWQGAVRDHFYTTNREEIGTTTPGQVGKYGYKSEGVAARVFVSRVRSSVPLYRYYQPQRRDHFYTTNPNEIGTTTSGRVGRYGYRSEGIAGFCYPKQEQGTIPLYRYWHGAVSDHFYTTNIREIGHAKPGVRGRYGYVSEGVACYVVPA